MHRAVRPLLLQTFGRASGPVKKVTYMAYWMRRYFFSNPFALPRELPETDRDWIHHALQRFAGADADVHGELIVSIVVVGASIGIGVSIDGVCFELKKLIRWYGVCGRGSTSW